MDYKEALDILDKTFIGNLEAKVLITNAVKKQYSIFLNHKEIENSDDEFMVVVHEYGHCSSGSTHALYSPYDLICRHEYKADRQSVLEFLPVELIKEASSKGCVLAHEFAEYLDMPEDFVRLAFKHYRAMDLI